MPSAFSYRGYAGEVVRGFVGLGTLPTLVPVVLLSAVLAGVGGWIAAHLLLPFPAPLLVMAIAVSPVAGRFGMAASAGQVHAGFFEAGARARGRMLGFVLRYGLLTLAWGVPASLAGMYLIKAGGGSLLGAAAGPAGVMVGVGVVLLIVTAVLAPTLTLIVALASDSLPEALSPDRWRWLLGERRGDLPALFAALLGGLALFYAIAVPVLLVLAALAAAVRPAFGLALAPVVFGLPAAGAPVLLGRLAGAFVAAESGALREPGEEGLAAHLARAGLLPAGGAGAGGAGAAAAEAAARQRALTPLPQPEPANGADPIALHRAVKDLDALAERDLPGAIEEGERLAGANPDHAGAAAELARLLLRAGRSEDAVARAGGAIRTALARGANPIAIDLFDAFRSHRSALGLDAAALERLGRVLLAHDRLRDAGRCFAAIAETGGDATRAQKGIIAVADAAARKGDAREAVAFYDWFLQKWPGSPFADYCADAARPLRARIGSGPG